MTGPPLLTRLEDVRRVGPSWVARCPAHEDRVPSLSVAWGRDGRTLLHCHAGCSVHEIVARLGVRMSDLMGEVPRRQEERRAPRPIRESTPEERNLGNEILLALWAQAVEVGLSTDHLRLVLSPPSQVPHELIGLAQEHELAVIAALEELQETRAWTMRGTQGQNQLPTSDQSEAAELAAEARQRVLARVAEERAR